MGSDSLAAFSTSACGASFELQKPTILLRANAAFLIYTICPNYRTLPIIIPLLTGHYY
jgi:hypothetical protein